MVIVLVDDGMDHDSLLVDCESGVRRDSDPVISSALSVLVLSSSCGWIGCGTSFKS